MISPRRRYMHPLALACCILALWLASTSAQARCTWGSGSPTSMTFQREMGTFWVPRDAPVGALIGKASLYASNDQGANLTCFYDPVTPVTATLPNSAPLFAGSLPPVGGKPVDGRVMETNIKGVGVFIDLMYPYDGSASNTFTPDNGTAIPYSGVMTPDTAIGMPLGAIYGEAMFIKIGDIDPGPQRIDQEVLHGFIHDLGNVMAYRVKATVNRAQCTLKADAVSADPVLLGDYQVDDFKGVGTHTPAVPFHITLNDCIDSSAPGAKRADVYIFLDGVKGSMPIEPEQGLFSLTTASEASGIGIQILRSDDSPMPLRSDQLMKELDVGLTRLDFRARFVQTDPKVTPGVAEGALNFTVSYR
ncbi:type 1 fimbrial protein [Pseudomonas alkylphenolica]|uniref:Type 1 fimbrial protein n=1 Tax=Pseudomonas alkylphenolica TaxID=237609 RepID=A0A443ZGB8_9PSED|nr:fimbrial protein [Pseudomonas alkylphenolica]RWU17869.1 type 1 fimbrial protein [Pseudomonas alkylphenolica]